MFLVRCHTWSSPGTWGGWGSGTWVCMSKLSSRSTATYEKTSLTYCPSSQGRDFPSEGFARPEWGTMSPE